ncbi:S41 family peptidase [Arcticibacterium luteifluviistationis]|uniref:Tail specific protease domain-containing protein n=1 Tax=Arcticibacterium luteifluviistationis TaxID=1784714 RepID=A0A2Z4G820_9BACT|nr:S41 family peptidase [Arcticibacterium luteifluviistationis]AWV97250.1 hypothetical protein DJ013_03320 [Arcticibacterium luteifluviistationis]
MQKVKSFLILFFFSLSTCFSQSEISAELLKEDLSILKFNLEHIHAGFYTYTNKPIMDEEFDRLRYSLTQPMSSIAFYRKLIDLNKFIRNGHTNIMPNAAYEKAIKQSFTLLPLEVYFDKNTLYILKNNSADSSIKEGSQIITINGENAVELFKEISEKMPRDGYNTTFPEKITNLSFNELYASIKGVSAMYKLELISPNGEIVSLDLKGLTKELIKKNKWERYQDDGSWWGMREQPVLKLNIDKEAAVMGVQTFSIYYAKKVKQNFKKFFDESFAQLEKAKVKHLIIDLRDNGGGDEQPTLELFSHLTEQPFTFYEDMYTITNKIPNPKFYNLNGFYMNALYPIFKLKKNEDRYSIKGIPGMKTFKPADSVFKGKVYVLTNGHSFSATGEITSFIKNANRATFIGEEVGGNTNQNVSGTTGTLTLPNSKVRVRIPIELFKLNVNHLDSMHGVIPDYTVRNSIQDELEGNDSVMNFALKLIAKQK